MVSTKVEEIIKNLERNNKVIPATYDSIFKALFLDPDMRDNLAFIISEITKIDKSFLYESMIVENSEIPKPNAFLKNNTTDVLVSVLNKSILLEMNRYNTEDNEFRNMAHYYSEIVKTIRVADSYDTISMVYQINFDREKKFGNKIISEFKMMDAESGIVADNYFRQYRISLAKAKELDYTCISKLTKFERLLLILQLDSKKELRRLAKGDDDLMKMVDKIEELSQNPKYVSLYDEERLAKTAQSLYVHEENEKIAHATKLETAKNLINMNMSIGDISKATGLSEEEIKSLKK